MSAVSSLGQVLLDDGSELLESAHLSRELLDCHDVNRSISLAAVDDEGDGKASGVGCWIPVPIIC